MRFRGNAKVRNISSRRFVTAVRSSRRCYVTGANDDGIGQDIQHNNRYPVFANYGSTLHNPWSGSISRDSYFVGVNSWLSILLDRGIITVSRKGSQETKAIAYLGDGFLQSNSRHGKLVR